MQCFGQDFRVRISASSYMKPSPQVENRSVTGGCRRNVHAFIIHV